MDWEKFEKKLDEKVAMLQKEQLATPAREVSTTTAVGAAAIVLGCLSAAVAAGRK